MGYEEYRKQVERMVKDVPHIQEQWQAGEQRIGMAAAAAAGGLGLVAGAPSLIPIAHGIFAKGAPAVAAAKTAAMASSPAAAIIGGTTKTISKTIVKNPGMTKGLLFGGAAGAGAAFLLGGGGRQEQDQEAALEQVQEQQQEQGIDQETTQQMRDLTSQLEAYFDARQDQDARTAADFDYSGAFTAGGDIFYSPVTESIAITQPIQEASPSYDYTTIGQLTAMYSQALQGAIAGMRGEQEQEQKAEQGLGILPLIALGILALFLLKRK